MKVFELLSENISQPTTFTLSVPPSKECPEIADLQKVLKALKYNLGPTGVDGVLGEYTIAAIKDAQADVEQSPTGIPDAEFIDVLNQVLEAYPDFAAGLSKSTATDVIKGGNKAGYADIAELQSPDFNTKLEKISNALGVKSSDLRAIMRQESGSKGAQAYNKTSRATGLIQFMPKTAKSLGTSVEELYKMTAVEQLDYVYKYFKSVNVQPGTDLGGLYMAVFYPKYMHKPDNHVISVRGNKVYDQNRGLDRNHDGTITVADVKQSVARYA